MKCSEVLARLQGCRIHGQIRVSGSRGGSMVQICLYVPAGSAQAYRVQIAGPGGGSMDLPQLPICGQVGKMTYLDGRFCPEQLADARVLVSPLSGCGGETASGTFCPAGSDIWPSLQPPLWGNGCAPQPRCREDRPLFPGPHSCCGENRPLFPLRPQPSCRPKPFYPGCDAR